MRIPVQIYFAARMRPKTTGRLRCRPWPTPTRYDRASCERKPQMGYQLPSSWASLNRNQEDQQARASRLCPLLRKGLALMQTVFSEPDLTPRIRFGGRGRGHHTCISRRRTLHLRRRHTRAHHPSWTFCLYSALPADQQHEKASHI
jgi:hypothetical protein